MELEIEAQRPGRNKDTTVNKSYISSGEYRRKFDKIVDDKDLARLLYSIASNMLKNVSGNTFEEMYWIDPISNEIIARETNQSTPGQIIYSQSTIKAIKKHNHLITLHTHPHSFPPSVEDFNSNFQNNYLYGIIICHDGKIFVYSSLEFINEQYFQLVIKNFMKKCNNECEAQHLAIEKLKENRNITYWEV